MTPHRLRARAATLLLDAGMPLDQGQKFLRHERIMTTQIDAQTRARNMGESCLRAMSGRQEPEKSGLATLASCLAKKVSRVWSEGRGVWA